MGVMTMFFVIASVGRPGLGNFIGEFLVLLGAFKVNVTLTVLATIGIVGCSSLWAFADATLFSRRAQYRTGIHQGLRLPRAQRLCHHDHRVDLDWCISPAVA